MAGDRDTLLSMGFEAARVDWALRATGNAGLQPALDFLFAHTDDPIPDASAQTSSSSVASGRTEGVPAGDEDDEDAEALRAALGKGVANVAPSSEGAGEGAEVEAKSIKCTQCGKVFKNTALANFHAEKSGHDQFEESTEEVRNTSIYYFHLSTHSKLKIKPLTEEEKKQKLAELRAKLAEKRAQKSVEEVEEARSNAAIRRKADREAAEAREQLKVKEALKAAEEMKREKAQEKKAREEIRRKIEQDKQERREKQMREKALREGMSVPDPAPVQPAPVASTSSAQGIPASEYKETRLQIRFGGKPYITTLPSDSTLREAAEFLAAQTLSVDVETVNFSTQYPRQTFTRDDFAKTLRELKLTPSAVLIAS
ncbi:hypothetical protein A7U60_g5226 [Sanghuangporus baumii]|uniref:UBX domain-containing protein n=1 Tax=Sanghuangporus baumii TaxID=108892 RepID=A0A9Q5HX90_SANBA|nr:hypothetical protein A7U60_g5226 [Sanghuangporus baumii]